MFLSGTGKYHHVTSRKIRKLKVCKICPHRCDGAVVVVDDDDDDDDDGVRIRYITQKLEITK